MPFTSTKTAPDGPFAGKPAQAKKLPYMSYRNAEASQELPFGTMAIQGTGDNDAKVATATTNKMIGVVANEYRYAIARNQAGPSDLGTIGLKPNASVLAAQEGPITVVVGEAVTPASAVRVRMDTNAGALGTANGPGTFCTAASVGHTVRLPFARFLTSTTGAGLVDVDLNMAMRDTAIAD